MLAACLVIAGCATRGPLLQPTGHMVELADTPFFAQDEYQCGPAALAMVLNASGVMIEPDTLVPQVYLPGRQGSLQIEMLATPRRHDRLAYPIGTELESITRELDAGRPVVVLHNYGLPRRPRWHYAVVIGYDPVRQQMLLRSGTTRRQVLPAAHFMRAWDNADRWAMVLLRPGELPATPDRVTYFEAATAFERGAAPASAARAYEAALQLWPEDPVPHVGRGTARFRDGDMAAAAADYRRAVELDPLLPVPRNNLAMTLLELGCPRAAQQQLAQISTASLPDALRDALEDTRAQIAARSNHPDNAACNQY